MRKGFATCHGCISGNNSVQPSQITLLKRAYETTVGFTEFAQAQ